MRQTRDLTLVQTNSIKMVLNRTLARQDFQEGLNVVSAIASSKTGLSRTITLTEGGKLKAINSHRTSTFLPKIVRRWQQILQHLKVLTNDADQDRLRTSISRESYHRISTGALLT